LAYDFPGNIRELRNILERASLLADDDCVSAEHLPAEVVRGAGLDLAAPTDPPVRNESALRDAERQALALALTRHRGSRRSLAQALGVSERTMYRKLASFGLSNRR
jgi:DNA-binding NtrC family response regulator